MKLKEISEKEKVILLEEVKKYRLLLDYYNSLLSYFLMQNKYYDSDDSLNSIMNSVHFYLIDKDISASVFKLLSSNYTLNELNEKKVDIFYKDELNRLLKRIISTCMCDDNCEYLSYDTSNNDLLVMFYSEIEKELKDNEILDEFRNFDKALLRSSELLSLSEEGKFQIFNQCNFSDVFYWNIGNCSNIYHNSLIDYLKEKKEQGELSDEQYEKFITEFTIQLLETIPKMKRMDYSHNYFFIEDILETIAGKVTDDDFEKYGVTVDNIFRAKKICLRFKALDAIISRFAKKEDFSLKDYYNIIKLFFFDIEPQNNSSFVLYAIERAEDLGEDYNSPVFELIYLDNILIDNNIEDWILHHYSNYTPYEKKLLKYALKNRKDFNSDVVQNLFNQINSIEDSEIIKDGNRYTKKKS